MKKFITTIFIFLVYVTFSFGQVYKIHIDSVVNFEYPATLSMSQSIDLDMITYTGGGETGIDYIVDFNKMKITTKFYTGDSSIVDITKKINTFKTFILEAMSENGNITKIYVTRKRFDEYSIDVLWNVIDHGVPLVRGWRSENISFK